MFGAIAAKSFPTINRAVPWYRLPVRLAVLNLDAFRGVLRTRNLIDTEPHEAPPQTAPRATARSPNTRGSPAPATARYNDLSAPHMGAVGATFGRNLRADYRPDSFDEPNPVVVADTLLTRDTLRAGRFR